MFDRYFALTDLLSERVRLFSFSFSCRTKLFFFSSPSSVFSRAVLHFSEDQQALYNHATLIRVKKAPTVSSGLSSVTCWPLCACRGHRVTLRLVQRDSSSLNVSWLAHLTDGSAGSVWLKTKSINSLTDVDWKGFGIGTSYNGMFRNSLWSRLKNRLSVVLIHYFILYIFILLPTNWMKSPGYKWMCPTNKCVHLTPLCWRTAGLHRNC